MNRFSLTKSCLVAAAPCMIATAASAEVATFNFVFDTYLSEVRWGILNSAGTSTIAYSAPSGPMYVGSSLLLNSPTIVQGNSASSSSSFSYTFDVQLDLPAGNYIMVLIDTYGDGWTWGGVSGGVSFADDAVGDSILMTGGQQISGSFTVVPAPASLALLGLAGLSRRRRS